MAVGAVSVHAKLQRQESRRIGRDSQPDAAYLVLKFSIVKPRSTVELGLAGTASTS